MTCGSPKPRALRAQDGAESEAAAAATRESIAAYRQLLDDQPDAASTDAVLYQLARAYESLGETDEALSVLDRLVTGYPGSSHFDEAQFRRGEAFFSEQRYADAEQAYAAVLSRRNGLRILRAGALQARLVALQAVA